MNILEGKAFEYKVQQGIIHHFMNKMNDCQCTDHSECRRFLTRFSKHNFSIICGQKSLIAMLSSPSCLHSTTASHTCAPMSSLPLAVVANLHKVKLFSTLSHCWTRPRLLLVAGNHKLLIILSLHMAVC